MIAIPNLFGAYIDGKEAAIKANWQDLNNYEDLELKRTNVDKANLDLLAAMQDFGYDREAKRFNYNSQARKDAVDGVSHIGNMLDANRYNLSADAKYSVAQGAYDTGQLHRHYGNKLETTLLDGETGLNNSIVNNFQAYVQRAFIDDPKFRQAYIDNMYKSMLGRIYEMGIKGEAAEKLAKLWVADQEAAFMASTSGNILADKTNKGKIPTAEELARVTSRTDLNNAYTNEIFSATERANAPKNATNNQVTKDAGFANLMGQVVTNIENSSPGAGKAIFNNFPGAKTYNVTPGMYFIPPNTGAATSTTNTSSVDLFGGTSTDTSKGTSGSSTPAAGNNTATTSQNGGKTYTAAELRRLGQTPLDMTNTIPATAVNIIPGSYEEYAGYGGYVGNGRYNFGYR